MSDALAIEPGRSLTRLQRIHAQWIKGSNDARMWNDAGALCISTKKRSKGEDDTEAYKKSAAFQLHFLSIEFPDTVIVLTKAGVLYILSSPQKCKHLEGIRTEAARALSANTNEYGGISVILLSQGKEEEENKIPELLDAVRDAKKIGVILKEHGKLGPGLGEKFAEAATGAGLEFVDMAMGLGLALAVKDEAETKLMKQAAVLSNKVMKHAFIEKMEDVIENDKKVTHAELSNEIEDVIDDPTKVKVKIPVEDSESCYPPIVQSGGEYDLRMNAQSTNKNLSPDLIIVSLGARYKSYCGTLTRSFFVDPPKQVQEVYLAALQTHLKCVDMLQHGAKMKSVAEAAQQHLQEKHPELVPYLTKSVGFALGLDFKEKACELTVKNNSTLRAGMVFNLSVGLQDVPLRDKSKKGFAKFEKFSVAIADMVLVKAKGEQAELLTKCGKEWTNVSYTLGGDSDNEADDSDAEVARAGRDNELNSSIVGERRLRDRGNQQEVIEQHQAREQRMADLIKKRAQERAKEQRKNKNKGDNSESEEEEVEDLKAYASTELYPKDTVPNQVKVDMDAEVVLLPINGQPVPFAIHTIKNVVMPEADQHSYYLRINFFAPGLVGKEASRKMTKLIDKISRKRRTFIKELTFRSLDQRNLNQAFRQIQELRKRLRQREQKEVETADLIVQPKLIRLTDMKVPRLADLILRPNVSGKTTGALEAHTNGLRFVNNKGDNVDVLYGNIRLAVFQPCEGNDTKIVLHFHLKHPIMVGKKAHKDIQVYTEAMDSIVNLDNARRSHYDPDEIMEEQRDRQLRKRLNQAFKEFAAKVTKVAQRNQQELEFDIPYHELGFFGNPHREMVFIQPTTYALVNVTDTPPFIVPLGEIEHVHFERVNPNARNFDVKFIMRSNMQPGGAPEPISINMIEQKYLNQIMGWLEDSSITYTQTDKAWNWKNLLQSVVHAEGDRFYLDTDEDGEKKPAGWAFLRLEASDSEADSGDEEGSDFQAESDGVEEEEESDESFDSDESDASDDGDEELEEEGLSWDELEAKAAADDKARHEREPEPEAAPKAKRRKK